MAFTGLAACADNSLEKEPRDDNFPWQLVLDTDAGAALPEAEDYAVEVKFADYLPAKVLPNSPITVSYRITDLQEDFINATAIDKVIYEVEIDDCTYERELEFTTTGDNEITGTILLQPDNDLKTLPESFEIVFTLPALENTSGGFVFEITGVTGAEEVIAGSPQVFEYEVLSNDVAGEWEFELSTPESFEAWKEIFAPLSPELDGISFEDITGKVSAEFEFEEMKWVIELVETEEITTCEDGETETEVENKVIEIEAEYEAEEGELVFEGSHILLGDDGEPEGELDFIMEATYELTELNTVKITFLKVIDEDQYKEGEELFVNESGYTFELSK